MNTVKEIMMAALQKGACDKSYGVSDWKTLVWLFFTPQGFVRRTTSLLLKRSVR